MSRYPNLETKRILEIWQIQSEFSKITRWKTSLEKPGGENLRRQTCTEHVLSVELAARIITDTYVSITGKEVDRALILDAFHFHDYGEPLKGRDLSALTKKDTDDLDEYLAFMDFIVNQREPLFSNYQRAFLLQFCLENPECFPPEAREIMTDLRKNKHLEAVMFKFIEKMDYVLYAIEQYEKKWRHSSSNQCSD